MTAPADLGNDPVQAFRAALPPHARARLNRTERLVALIHAAVRKGWSIDQLVTEATRDHNNAINTGAVIMFRLEQCAVAGPVLPTGGRAIPFCSTDCRDNAGWIVDDRNNPIRRCPCRTPQEATV